MKIDLSRFIYFDISKLYLIDKEWLATALFFTGMLIAFLGSMYTWFLNPLGSYYCVLASLFVGAAMLVSKSMRKTLFNNSYFLVPVMAYFLLAYYQAMVNSKNANGFITPLFHGFLFYAIFRYDEKRSQALANFLAKAIGSILVVSIFFFFLYLLGFPLPHSDQQFKDAFYTYSNYYFFLIDDMQLMAFVPRFQSVFMEPTYLGSVTALLLMTQRGKWLKWYNVAMMVALILSFSLAGYVYIVAITFLNLWVQRKRIFMKLIAVLLVIGSVVGGSFFYNQGDNLIQNLILLRLEVDDGELEGNNRVTKDFDAEFENFMQSTDIFFGREKEDTFGDSGAKVYIYDYGFVGLFLLVVFYFSAFYKASDKRSMTAAMFIGFLVFLVDAFVLWYGRFLPLYCTALSKPAGGEDADTDTTDSPQEEKHSLS